MKATYQQGKEAGGNGTTRKRWPGILVLPLILLVLSPAAQPAAASSTPNAGQLLQQVTPEPHRPRAGARVPLTLPETSGMSEDTTPLPAHRVKITGNSVFSEETLENLIASQLAGNKALTLKRLSGMARTITHYYRAHGYMLARAYVPAQTLVDDTVQLAVLEAHYGKIQLNNSSRVRDARLQSYLSPLHSGDPVLKRTLDRPLLLMDRLPGAAIQARLAPGSHTGESDLYVDASAAPLLDGQVRFDNYGNKATGRYEGSGLLHINSPLHLGDRLSLYWLTSGTGMNYERASYSLPVNGQGTEAGASYSYLHYHLQDQYADLGAKGHASVGSLWIEHPLLLTRDSLLNIRLQGYHKELADQNTSADIDDKRYLDSVALSLVGSFKDDFLGGGITGANVTIRGGDLVFRNAAAEASDAATAHTRGGFRIWTAALSRLQFLSTHTRLYLGINGQYSPDNLDSSEQFVLGGIYSIPGYEPGTLSGSSGYLATIELLHDLTFLPHGHWQGSIFADNGYVRVNADPWTAGDNSAFLSDAGVGLSWTGPNQVQIASKVAWPVGSTPSLAGERPSARLWFSLGMEF